MRTENFHIEKGDDSTFCLHQNFILIKICLINWNFERFFESNQILSITTHFEAFLKLLELF